MASIAVKVAAMAEKLGADPVYSGNIATNLQAITLQKEGEVSNTQNISVAVHDLTEVVGEEEQQGSGL